MASKVGDYERKTIDQIEFLGDFIQVNESGVAMPVSENRSHEDSPKVNKRGPVPNTIPPLVDAGFGWLEIK